LLGLADAEAQQLEAQQLDERDVNLEIHRGGAPGAFSWDGRR
jgi:hypothetical protein